uniref:Uncharacterized protein LOC100186329 n=1 Tax=Phallusia mammillata TaxID=59560 RepID=A0A6F9DHR4_9ASCI|nr:uncharacterized protein LOC100186329 [Phallusia mammillata]
MASRHHNAHSRANSGSRTDVVTWVGGSCGRHGSYVFYKAFRFSLAPEQNLLPASNSATLRNRNRERRSFTARTDDNLDESFERDGFAPLINERILSLGEFFFVQCRPEDPVCVGEVQLLWHDKHSGQDLASTRLYYLPETTPAGRTSQHGEDEMLAVSDKIVMRTTDLASWIVEPSEWNYGSPLLLTPPHKNGGFNHLSGAPLHRYSMLHSCVNMNDINAEKRALLLSKNGYGSHSTGKPQSVSGQMSDQNPADQSSNSACCEPPRHKAEVVMLSMNAYCRHKALMKRVQHVDRDWLARPGAKTFLTALGAVTSENPKARVVFCRDTFEYPQLFEHDLICEELAPVFKGRPRKKPKKNGAVGSKSNNKKTSNGNPRGRNTDSPVDMAKLEVDATTPTRRSSSRRRSKRKSPQTIAYEDQFVPFLVRSSKRTRRTPVRTPTPVGESGIEKEDSGAGSSRGLITAATVAQTVDVVAESSALENSAVGRRKTKARKRSGRRSSVTALNIAIQNSLLENHKPVWPSENTGLSKKKTSSSVSSSRSASPSTELLLASHSPSKAPSPAESSVSSASSTHSNDVYASSSPSSSPINFLTHSADEQDKSGTSSPCPGAELFLHGLMDGKIPENKSAFLDKLYQFMRKRNTPIGRIPSLGFKKLDLWAFFKLSQEYGGYDMVTAKRLWKHVYDRMGGNPSCTSAATCTRKHFERLLLPFEMHLRQQLRNKEPEAREHRNSGSDDSTTGNATNEHLSSKESNIVQRAYNGDAYFINGAKSKVGTPPKTIPTKVTSPENGYHDSKDAESKSFPIVSDEKPSVSQVSSKPSSFVKFETLAHNVIREELLTSRPNDVIRPAKASSPEDLSAGHGMKFDTKEDTKAKLSPPPPINVTSRPPTSSTSPVTSLNGAQYTRASVIVGTSRMPQQQPSDTPFRSMSIPTRTFCPRMSNAPPPFVPKSKPTLPLPEHGKTPPGPSIDLTRQPPPPIDTSPSDKFSTSRLQKRPHDDHHLPVSTSNPRTISPSSPKRHRTEIAQSRVMPPSASHGRYDIRNLMALDDQKLEDVYKPMDIKSSSYNYNQQTSNHHRHMQSNLKAEPPVLLSPRLTRIPPEARQPRPSFVDPRRLDESQRPVIKPDARRGAEPKRPMNGFPVARPGVDGRMRPVSPPKRIELPREQQQQPRKGSYYRPPNGMIAASRQMWQQKEQSSPRDTPNRPQHKPTDSRSPVITNGVNHGAEKSKIQYVPRTRSPPQPEQRPYSKEPPQTKPFSSSFSVDRLTADTRNIKLHPNNKPQHSSNDNKPRVMHSSPETPQHPSHGYMKPMERKLNQPQIDPYKLPRRPEVRPEYQEPLKRPSAGPQISVPRSPCKDNGAAASAFLSSLPPSVANTPKMLEHALQEAMKSVVTNPLMHPELQEALLRQHIEKSQQQMRIITHQEQQAAAATHLARAALLSSHMRPQDPAALAMYQQLAIRQMQESASSGSSSAKLQHDLHDLARYGVPAFTSVPGQIPGAIRNASFVAAPLPHFSNDVGSPYYPSYARR